MAPPGGQSQINIFGQSEQPTQHHVNKHQAHRNQSSIFGSPEQKAPSEKPAPPKPAQSTAPSAQSSSVTAQPQNPTAPDGGRASTKVMAPPGGKTSINLFG